MTRAKDPWCERGGIKHFVDTGCHQNEPSCHGCSLTGRSKGVHMLRIVCGTPSDEELAALTAVLAASPHGAANTPPPRGSAWAASAARLRTSLHPGPGAWKAAVLPR